MSSSESSTQSASASASSSGGKRRFGIATTVIPAACAERMPLCESSIAAQYVPLRLLVPAPAALADELLARPVPDLLGVDQDSVEVEDDGVDHSDTYRRSRYRSGGLA